MDCLSKIKTDSIEFNTKVYSLNLNSKSAIKTCLKTTRIWKSKYLLKMSNKFDKLSHTLLQAVLLHKIYSKIYLTTYQLVKTRTIFSTSITCADILARFVLAALRTVSHFLKAESGTLFKGHNLVTLLNVYSGIVTLSS